MPSFSTDPFQYLRRRALGLMGGGGGSTPVVYDPDAAAYFAAMSVQPDDARKSLINDLIVGLKADGVWSKTRLLYLRALGTQQAALLNAKTPGTNDCTIVGTVTFTADRGFRGDGSTGYLNTGFNPTTASPVIGQNSLALYSYVNNTTSDVAGNETTWGSGGSSRIRLLPLSGSGVMSARLNNSTNNSFNGAALTTRLGSRAVSRTGATTSNGQMNGVAVGVTDTTSSSAPVSAVMELLRDSGTMYNGLDRIAADVLADGLSGAEMTALHARTLTFLTAIGAN